MFKILCFLMMLSFVFSGKAVLFYIEDDCIKSEDNICPIYLHITWNNKEKMFGVETSETILKPRKEEEILDIKTKIQYKYYSFNTEINKIIPSSSVQESISNFIDLNNNLDQLINGEIINYNVDDKNELT